MAKAPKKPPPKDEDLEEWARFLALAHELEVAGDLNPTEGQRAFEKLMEKAVPPKRTPEKPQLSST